MANEKIADGKAEILNAVLNDKTIKAKAKTGQILQRLLQGDVSVPQLISFAALQPDAHKASLIEVIEHASKIHPEMVDENALEFVIQNLTSAAPRVKWESAKVVGNVIHLFPKHVKKATGNLLNNTESKGTVVRWSAAYALAQIVNCKTPLNTELIPAIEAIIKREQDNAIIKIYQKAIAKAK